MAEIRARLDNVLGAYQTSVAGVAKNLGLKMSEDGEELIRETVYDRDAFEDALADFLSEGIQLGQNLSYVIERLTIDPDERREFLKYLEENN